MNLDKFAVVISSQALTREFGETFVGRTGVCRVTGDIAETQILPDFMVEEFIDGYARVPSHDPAPAALLPFHAELEAVHLIREEAQKLRLIENSTLPANHYRVSAMELGHFFLTLGQGWIDVAISPTLADRLSVREGDRFCLAASNDHQSFCLFYDQHGADLSSDSVSGGLSARFYVADSVFGTVYDLEGVLDRRLSIRYDVRDNRVHFLKNDVLNASGYWSRGLASSQPKDVILVRKPHRQLLADTPLARLAVATADFVCRWTLFFPYR